MPPRGAWSPQHDRLRLIASLLEAGVTLDVVFDTLATMGGSGRTRQAAASLTELAGWAYHLGRPEVWPVPNSIEDIMMPGYPRFRLSGPRRLAYRQ